MSDRGALYASILASDEDTPRLVFADWLENGDAKYAAFIRKQIELARVLPEWDPLWIQAWYNDRDAITGNGYTTFTPKELPDGWGAATHGVPTGFAWHVEAKPGTVPEARR